MFTMKSMTDSLKSNPRQLTATEISYFSREISRFVSEIQDTFRVVQSQTKAATSTAEETTPADDADGDVVTLGPATRISPITEGQETSNVSGPGTPMVRFPAPARPKPNIQANTYHATTGTQAPNAIRGLQTLRCSFWYEFCSASCGSGGAADSRRGR